MLASASYGSTGSFSASSSYHGHGNWYSPTDTPLPRSRLDMSGQVQLEGHQSLGCSFLYRRIGASSQFARQSFVETLSIHARDSYLGQPHSRDDGVGRDRRTRRTGQYLEPFRCYIWDEIKNETLCSAKHPEDHNHYPMLDRQPPALDYSQPRAKTAVLSFRLLWVLIYLTSFVKIATIWYTFSFKLPTYTHIPCILQGLSLKT